MRHLMLFVVLAMFAPVPSQAQGTYVWFESQNRVGPGVADIASQINVSASKKFTKTLGVFHWSLVSKGWSESIIGGTWSPKSSVEFALGGGIETNKNPGRVLGSVFLSHRLGTLFAAGEDGGSGKWFLVEGSHAVGGFGFGFRAQRFVGIGPRIEVNAQGMKLWMVPYTWGIEHERKGNMVFGIRFTP